MRAEGGRPSSLPKTAEPCGGPANFRPRFSREPQGERNAFRPGRPHMLGKTFFLPSAYGLSGFQISNLERRSYANVLFPEKSSVCNLYCAFRLSRVRSGRGEIPSLDGLG